MATTQLSVLPGDIIPSAHIPRPAKKQLKLGPGLHHTPPSTIRATIPGTLHADFRKNAIWIDHAHGGRYIPRLNDPIILTIHHSSTDIYHAVITPHTPLAILPQLAFEGASRKTRPQLTSGDLVYARVSAAPAGSLDSVELECVSATTGRADGLGPLKGGMVWDVSQATARRLLLGEKGGCVVLSELGKRAAFEVAVGRNGRVWVGGDMAVVLGVGRAVRAFDEEGDVDVGRQRKIVEKVIK
ncbi:exosome complex exonuclease RRP40, partial [Microthyrium microscopicum]